LAWYLKHPLESPLHPVLSPKKGKGEEEAKDGPTLSKIQSFDNGNVGLYGEEVTLISCGEMGRLSRKN